MKEMKTDDAILRFVREGHYFIPGTENGVGEVTYLCAGEEICYVQCTTETFLKKVGISCVWIFVACGNSPVR